MNWEDELSSNVYVCSIHSQLSASAESAVFFSNKIIAQVWKVFSEKGSSSIGWVKNIKQATCQWHWRPLLFLWESYLYFFGISFTWINTVEWVVQHGDGSSKHIFFIFNSSGSAEKRIEGSFDVLACQNRRHRLQDTNKLRTAEGPLPSSPPPPPPPNICFILPGAAQNSLRKLDPLAGVSGATWVLVILYTT